MQHFAHAGTLIKLIGGRKKSKLLFRSTKIQVFKDINLIRLRDGCSGISIDLWFPSSPAMLLRSQQHTALIRQMLSDFPHSFYPLAIVLKSFMAQNLLNSGYSGLGSYGVLLMLIRYLQLERFMAAREGRKEETNLGKLLVGFFRLYATFDYMHKAIDVVNVGDGDEFVDKPATIIVKRARKPTDATAAATAAAAAAASETIGSVKTTEVEAEGSEGEGEETEHQPTTTPAPATAASDHGTDSDATAAELRESASLRKKRNNAADKFTLIILDPMDPENQIICHHKALRNMIGAFIRAVMILDPDNPAPPLMLPPLPSANHATDPAASIESGQVKPALTATGPGVVTVSAPRSGAATPELVPQPLQSLPQFPGLSATANQSHATRFHRLLEVESARHGPQTKPCPSAHCMNPDGTSKSQVPTQNKICFTCGHVFVRPGHGQQTNASGSKGHKQQATNAHTIPLGHSQQGQLQHQAMAQRRPSHIGQGHVARHQPHHQQMLVQKGVRGSHAAPSGQTSLLQAQAMLAAQQLLSQQLAGVSAPSVPSSVPMPYYPMQDAYASLPNPTSATTSATMSAMPLYATALDYNAFNNQMMYNGQMDAASAASSMNDAYAMQTIMQQMQSSNPSAGAPQQSYLMPNGNAAYMSASQPTQMYPPSPSMADAYLGPSYAPILTSGYSPIYPTRSLSDPIPDSAAAAAMNMGMGMSMGMGMGMGMDMSMGMGMAASNSPQLAARRHQPPRHRAHGHHHSHKQHANSYQHVNIPTTQQQPPQAPFYNRYSYGYQ